MKFPARLYFMLFVCVIVVLFIPGSVHAQPIGFAMIKFSNDLTQHTAGILESPQDFMREGDFCNEKCGEYSGYVTNPYITTTDSILMVRGRPVGLSDSDYNNYQEASDYWCGCANENYNQALKICPVDDLATQAEIYQSAATMYTNYGNPTIAEAAQMKSNALAKAAEEQQGLPLSPLLAIMSVLVVVILLQTRRNT